MTADLLDTPLDGYDADAVEAAADQVRGHLGWHLAPTVTETLTLDGTASSILLLPSLRVTAVAGVVEDGTTLDPSSWAWSTNGVLERLPGIWTAKRRAVVVTFTHGYDTCPPAVRQVVARLAVLPAAAGIRSETQGPYARTFEPGARSGYLDEYAERILARYRLPGRS